MSKNNVLLQKTELGKIKTGFHDLPESHHVYGKAPAKDKFGAREGTHDSIQLCLDGRNMQFLISNNPVKTLWR
jgi:hypothetical protein